MNKNVNVIDLTQMFGATIADYIYSLETATAGSGVAFCRNYSPEIFSGYNAYNAGALLSVKTSQHNTIGFNQWDEQWELSGSTIKSKNPIRVLPNTTYYICCPVTADIDIVTSAGVYVAYLTSKSNATFTTPNDCEYIKFTMRSSYGTTYNNDICINISDGERNGQYEPYVINEYPLDADLELRGIPQLVNGAIVYDGDTYAHTGAVVRKYGIVDLGSLTYNYDTDIPRFWSNGVTGIKAPASNGNAFKAFSAIYKTVSFDNLYYTNKENMSIACSMAGVISIINNSYTDAAAFKTAMNGVYLIYELATPTAETADAFVSPQLVDNWGTEQYVDARAVPVPVGHSTEYDMNLRAKIETAPNAPDANGNYLMNHNNGENIYIPYVSPIPALPTANGNYILKCVVSGGVASLSWIEET